MTPKSSQLFILSYILIRKKQISNIFIRLIVIKNTDLQTDGQEICD